MHTSVKLNRLVVAGGGVMQGAMSVRFALVLLLFPGSRAEAGWVGADIDDRFEPNGRRSAAARMHGWCLYITSRGYRCAPWVSALTLRPFIRLAFNRPRFASSR